jgi:phenylacetate-CoA ligase
LNASSQVRAISSLQTFYRTSLDEQLSGRGTAEETALALFQDVAASVPAYRALLAEHSIDPASVRNLDDFKRLPILTKESYIQRFPLADLCRGGTLDSCDMIAVSSGSTGVPTFWPRSVTDEVATAYRFEQVFRDSFSAHERRTLAVVCFALGTWVGGMYTASCCRHLAAKGYPITVITPGNNKEEIFRVVQALAEQFDQTVLLGYPPFLKDVIDAGISRSVHWSRYGVKLIMAGEVFSEEWRTLVAERMGSIDPLYTSASIYGTADAGVLANETPLSIAIRRFLSARPSVARELFGESRLPTLAQYDPSSRYFEVIDDSLIFSGDNGIPLIRYNILDRGGVLGFQEMMDFLADHGFDPMAQLNGDSDPKSKIQNPKYRDLPFVWVFGRSDFTISFFGANIYPENVSVGLEQPEIREWVTGKFVLQSKEDTDHNLCLLLIVELAPGEQASESRRNQVREAVLAQLLRLNSEFAHYVPVEHRAPSVELRPHGDPEFFPVGVKHRYTRK